MDQNKVAQNNSGKKSQEEEIDLGQLFILIGKGFSKLFNFIGSIFRSIFNGIINFILFLRRNTIKLFIASLIGAVLGGVYQHYYKTTTYESSMTVQPNYGSSVQLYKNIDFYQNLVKQKDVEKLASNLNLSVEEAESITFLEVEPYENENQVLIAYESFISTLDSSVTKYLEYEKFAEEQPVESFKYHIITVKSKDKYIFDKLRSPIIASIIRNPYYDLMKGSSYSNLMRKKKAVEHSMSELDSLRLLYKRVMITESEKKSSGGTNFFMGNVGANRNDALVFDKFMDMNEILIDVNKQLAEESEVINVVSSFNPIGSKVAGLKRNLIVVGFIAGFIIAFMTIIVMGLNKELNHIEEKLKSRK
ncbi:MAG: hypothetical protein KAH10_07215 [Flavobacteriales bacterium]|nr:hypothetical protein [Flavobacteriales bacterium]